MAAQSAGAITVTVTRTGGSTGAASVAFATANGSAVAGSQYTQTSGTLQWATGDSSAKAVTVPISATAFSGSRTFSLNLSAAITASLGTPNSTTLTIVGSGPLVVKVQGNRLVDGSGNTLQLRGANYSGYEAACILGYCGNDASGAQDGQANGPKLAEMATWHINVIRFPLNEASWFGLTTYDATGASRKADLTGNYQTQILNQVNAATAAGFYVILDLHWSGPNARIPGQTGLQPITPFESSVQQPMADADHSIAFWTSVATMFKGYPNLLFELFNEPYMDFATGDQWTCWLAGCTQTQVMTGSLAAASTAVVGGGTIASFYGLPDAHGNTNAWRYAYSWQSAGMQQMLNAVRATGATNVVLVGGIGWAAEMSGWLAHAPADPLGQIGAVWHAYPNCNTVGASCATIPAWGTAEYGYVQAIAAQYPVVITETGDHISTTVATPPFDSVVLPWADQYGISYLGWTWDLWGAADDVLVKDSAGNPTPEFGQYFHDHLACRAAGNATCP